MSSPLSGGMCRRLIAGAAAGLGCLAFAGLALPAHAQLNPYCQYPYNDPYYCQYSPYGYNSFSYNEYYYPQEPYYSEQYYYPEEYLYPGESYYSYSYNPYYYEPYGEYSYYDEYPYGEYAYAPYFYGYYGGHRHFHRFHRRFAARQVTNRQTFMPTLRGREAQMPAARPSVTANRQAFFQGVRSRIAAPHFGGEHAPQPNVAAAMRARISAHH